ncbi:MAG: S-layer homology domain-containing protein [Cellulosilyticaceae bacterium]
MRIKRFAMIGAIVFGMGLLGNTGVVYANEVNIMSTQQEQLTLKTIKVNKSNFKFDQGSEETLLRNELVVTATYKESNEGQAVTNYETNFNEIKDKPGTHRVTISYAENGIVKDKEVCVTICPKTPEETKPVKHIQYIRGYEDGTFRPEGSITREELATMIGRLMLDGGTPTNSHQFTDLSESRYSTPYIAYVTSQGIMNGHEDGTFRPQDIVSKKEMSLAIDKVTNTRKNAVAASVSNEKITRTEAVIILNDVFDRECKSVQIVNPYSDMTTNYWAYEAIMAASIEHIHE